MAKNVNAQTDMQQARRRFLASCGKLAVATPPAVTLLLSGTRQSYATASSGGHQSYGHNGYGDNGFKPHRKFKKKRHKHENSQPPS